MPRPAEPLSVRLFAHRLVDADGCWLWTGSTRKGYGQIWTSLGDGHPRRLLATHRAMYELTRGPIAEGLDLDHLCQVITCMNPEHLEPVTRRENVQRARRAKKLKLAAA